MSKRPAPPPNVDSIDFDENPEWTEEDFARARPAREVFGQDVVRALVRKRGRPAGTIKPDAKKSITLRLDPDVIEAWRASGPGWQARMNDALRAAKPAG